jgi:hypothetical protein
MGAVVLWTLAGTSVGAGRVEAGRRQPVSAPLKGAQNEPKLVQSNQRAEPFVVARLSPFHGSYGRDGSPLGNRVAVDVPQLELQVTALRARDFARYRSPTLNVRGVGLDRRTPGTVRDR